MKCVGMMSGPAGSPVRLEVFDSERQETNTVELTGQKFLTLRGDRRS